MTPNYLKKKCIKSFLGKKHSEKTKKLMSAKAKERLKDPKKNSQYGTMWIYNESLHESKKINKDSEIPLGWSKGRKLFN